MMVKGKRTTVDQIDVDVNVREIIAKLYELSVPRELDFIGDDGFWYKQDEYDYHKREELYVKDRQATEQEMEMKKAYEVFIQFAKDNNL